MIKSSNSKVSLVSQVVFAQAHPRHTCTYLIDFMKRSVREGHRCKCRKIHCSLQCVRNWAQEEKWLQGHLLSGLPEQYHKFRGNLTMPPNATIEQHKKTRAFFANIISRYCTKNGCVIKYRWISDITSPTDMHYDITAWSDVAPSTLKELWFDAWDRADGKHSSLMLMSGHDIRQWSTYVVKARRKDQNKWRYVPAQNGLSFTFTSDGFWDNGTIKTGKVDRTTVKHDWVQKTLSEWYKIMLVSNFSNRPQSVCFDIGMSQENEAHFVWSSVVKDMDFLIYQSNDPIVKWATDFVVKFPDFATIIEIPQKPTYTQEDYDREIEIVRERQRNEVKRQVISAIPTQGPIGINDLVSKFDLPIDKAWLLDNVPDIEFINGIQQSDGNYVYNGIRRKGV